MRRTVLLTTACLAALTLAHPALAQSAMSMGVYLWTNPAAEPVRTQFLSIAGTSAEVEIDGPEGSNAISRSATPTETALLKTAIEGQMKALTLTERPQPATPYVTVEWHFSTPTGYADGAVNYAPDKVPAAVLALQQAAFGATFAGGQ
ncbi:MAG: hypothetical protein KGK00_14275 [Paracoccaceae bacterium]|nr:hypothetical protein [Paracoccaceae bacterium]